MVPTRYDLTLRPDIYSDDPANFHFTGSVNVSVDVVEATDVIYFHYRMLDIDATKVTVTQQGAASTDIKVL